MSFLLTKHLQNGDSIKRKLNEIDENNHNDFIEKNDGYFITEVITNISRDNYENNFIKVFDKHYKNIGRYIENLKFFNKKTEIYFLIADETVEGTGININGEYEFYAPIMNEKILLYLKEHLDVKGIIFQCSCIYNKKLFYYFKNTTDNIDKLLKENKKYFNKELVQENFKRINSFWRFDEKDE